MNLSILPLKKTLLADQVEMFDAIHLNSRAWSIYSRPILGAYQCKTSDWISQWINQASCVFVGWEEEWAMP